MHADMSAAVSPATSAAVSDDNTNVHSNAADVSTADFVDKLTWVPS